MKKAGFTLIEILVVLVILGFLGAMVVPKLQATLEISKSQLNKSTMQEIKRAALEFKRDVGFAPDNVVLMIYPFEECIALAKNYDDSASSSTCKNMIAFVDSRLNMNHYRLPGDGDYGSSRQRDKELIKEIKKRLSPKLGGWRGSYIGGNGHLLDEQIKKEKTGSKNCYFLSQQDIELYYDEFDENDTLEYIGANDYLKWQLIVSDFSNPDNNEAAKYRKKLIGELTILDQWGTPYEIQFPSIVPSGKSRERFARIVSFGKNRQRDTNSSKLSINYADSNYDDSVLYIYENNQTSYFH